MPSLQPPNLRPNLFLPRSSPPLLHAARCHPYALLHSRGGSGLSDRRGSPAPGRLWGRLCLCLRLRAGTVTHSTNTAAAAAAATAAAVDAAVVAGPHHLPPGSAGGALPPRRAAVAIPRRPFLHSWEARGSRGGRRGNVRVGIRIRIKIEIRVRIRIGIGIEIRIGIGIRGRIGWQSQWQRQWQWQSQP